MSIRSNVGARDLDQRIAIQRRVTAPDPEGGEVVTWSPVVSCWAKVDGAPASEQFAADAERSMMSYTFWLRADVAVRYDLRLTDRILWKGQPFDISSMPDQQLRGRLRALIATTGANDG